MFQPLINGPYHRYKLRKYTLEQLLDECWARLRSWNTCAVGEEFSLKKNFTKETIMTSQAREYLTDTRKISPELADSIMLAGEQITDQFLKVRNTFYEIRGLRIQANQKPEETGF